VGGNLMMLLSALFSTLKEEKKGEVTRTDH
jgi:hypothetical protein